MQEALISVRHQAGSLIPGAPTSQFQHRPPCNRRQTGEYRRLKFLHALTFYHQGASKNTYLPPLSSPNPTFQLPALQNHANHRPGKCQRKAMISRAALPAASCLPVPGTQAMLGCKGCLFRCEGQPTSTCSAPATTSSQNPLNPLVRAATPSSPLAWMQAAGWADPLSFWGNGWKSLNLPQTIGDQRCCPSATWPGEHLPTPGASNSPWEGDLDAGTWVRQPKNKPKRGKAASLPQHQGPCSWRSR